MKKLAQADISNLIKETVDLFKGKSSVDTIDLSKSPAQDEYSFLEQDDPNEFSSSKFVIKAPIHGTFYNSGGFSPGIATDKRHSKGHDGVDLRAAGGTPVFSIAPGIVTNVGTDPSGGNVVNIDHGNNLRTYYAHLGTIAVHKGDHVTEITQIGTVGDSGNAKGTVPHVHFQIWENNSLQNPEKYFAIPKYTNFDSKKERTWISDQHQQAAKSFNIQKHNSRQNQSLAQRLNKITKMADIYYKLTINTLHR